MTDTLRTIDDVVDTLQNAKEWHKGCSLLIGAGCSATAGIPTAAGFVDIIKDRFNRAYNRAVKKTYPECMSLLAYGERRDLIGEYVDNSKVNWAHIAIAQLIKAGYVDRVLTTNFDPLIVKACALLGVFPAVYDLAASQLFHRAHIASPAVFYLHGQRSGFVLMNTEEECQRHAKLLAPVFEDAGAGRVWIVVGYSGENDPVFDHLANTPRFDYNLFWAVYLDNPPPSHVKEQLLNSEKDAYYIEGFDADSFFVTLARKLACFPPDFVARPFSHLSQLLNMVVPYNLSDHDRSVQIPDYTQMLISQAIGLEDSANPLAVALRAQSLVMAGDYVSAADVLSSVQSNTGISPADLVFETLLMQAVELGEKAAKANTSEADQLYSESAKRYAEAYRLKPDEDVVLRNWGWLLIKWASTKTGEDVEKMLVEAAEKFGDIVKRYPGDPRDWHDWGWMLYRLASVKSGLEAVDLCRQAIEKYQVALNSEYLKADSRRRADILVDWGRTLIIWARHEVTEEAEQLLDEVEVKIKEVVQAIPDEDTYDLACLYAVWNKPAECRYWLEKCAEGHKLPSRTYLETDPHMENVRHLDWFKTILENSSSDEV